MAQAGTDKASAGAAADFEAQIRANARPVLSADERKVAANAKAALEARLAAARCREVAAAQAARADDYEAQASKLEKGN